jgi:phage shock protein PspC (stress-responsive transcriptional regulator)
MSHTTSATSPDSERLLVRPGDDRVVAGVCSGLARYFDMSPVVYRVAFAALILLGGAGLVLYAAAWLVIPEEGREQSILGQALHDHRERPWLVVGLGLIGFALVVAIAEGSLWLFDGDLWVAALVAGILLVWWQTSERRTAAPASPASAAEGDVPPPSPGRRRLPVFLPTLGVLIAGAGVLGLLDAIDVVDVDWTLALTIGVVLIGIAVAVGAFVGGVGGLAVVGVVLATLMVGVTALDIPLDGPIGSRTERPVSVQELDEPYRQSIGSLELDLRRLTLPAGTTHVETSVGIGELTVLVPPDARVDVDATVEAGEATVFGLESDGRNIDIREVQPGSSPAAPTLEIEAEVGFGNLEVRSG